MLKSIIAICVGASLGALLRWWFGLALNNYFPTIPPGTLTANLVGGYIIGLAIVFTFIPVVIFIIIVVLFALFRVAIFFIGLCLIIFLKRHRYGPA